jgi:hypothetical protein
MQTVHDCEDAYFDGITTILFNKNNLTLTMTEINVLLQLGASIESFGSFEFGVG